MRIHFTVAFLLGIAFPVEAQASRDSARARAIEALDIGAELRLVAAGREITGVLVKRSPLDLTLDRNGSPLIVPRMQVQALWEPGGRAAGTGFLVGAVLGGTAGGMLGWTFGAFMCESGCTGNQAKGAALGTVGGGLAVGFVGALIGSALQRWEQRFP